jgi:hypothetical protein
LGGYSEEEIDPLHPIRRGYSKGGIWISEELICPTMMYTFHDLNRICLYYFYLK